MAINESRLRTIIRGEVALRRFLLREGVVSDTLKTLFNSITSASVNTKAAAPAKQTSKKPAEGQKTLVDDAALLGNADTALIQVGNLGSALGENGTKAVESQGNRDIALAYGEVVDGVVSDAEKALQGVVRKWGQTAQDRGLSSGASIVAIVQGLMYAVAGKKFE